MLDIDIREGDNFVTLAATEQERTAPELPGETRVMVREVEKHNLYPASWTTGLEINMNTDHQLPDEVWAGLLYHELGLVCQAPRARGTLRMFCSRRAWASVFSLMEAARADHWLVTNFPASHQPLKTLHQYLVQQMKPEDRWPYAAARELTLDSALYDAARRTYRDAEYEIQYIHDTLERYVLQRYSAKDANHNREVFGMVDNLFLVLFPKEADELFQQGQLPSQIFDKYGAGAYDQVHRGSEFKGDLPTWLGQPTLDYNIPAQGSSWLMS